MPVCQARSEEGSAMVEPGGSGSGEVARRADSQALLAEATDWRLRYPHVCGAGLKGWHGYVDKPFGAWKTSRWPENVRDPDAVLQWLDFLTQGEPDPITFA